MRQETLDLCREGDAFTLCRRMELFEIGARWYDDHPAGVVVVVEAVLLLDLVVRAGDHEFGVCQHLLLGIDTTFDVVLLLYRFAGEAACQQPLALVAPERMPGVYQRDAEQVGQAHPDVTGIGIVAMDQVGQARLLLEPGHQVVHEAVQVIP